MCLGIFLLSPQSLPPFPIPLFITWVFLISALSSHHCSFLPFHWSTSLHPFTGGWHGEKCHWAQSSYLLLTFYWCCKTGGKSSPSRHPWERPGGYRTERLRNWDNNPSLIQNWLIQIPITHTNWSQTRARHRPRSWLLSILVFHEWSSKHLQKVRLHQLHFIRN